jgi:hypothetical protein
MISNRIYFVRDLSPSEETADETDLLNLTCDELDVDAAIEEETKSALKNILLNGTNGVKGFYRVLDQMGTCDDVSSVVASDPTFFEGQHILSQPTLFFKNVYFTGYQPVLDDPCNPAGNGFIHAMDYSFGASVFDYADDDEDNVDNSFKSLKDTYRFISGSSIPSGVRVIMRDGHAAGLISAGGAVAGVGEDGSTTIPGPPGGLTPLLWETE